MIQRFRRFSSSSARTRLTTRAMRRCSAAPALAFTATGLEGAERRSVSTTPSTPAPSATRSSAPRFCGSSTPSSASSSRGRAAGRFAAAGSKRSSMARNSCGRTSATTPCAPGLRQLGQLLARLWRTRTPASRQRATSRSRRSSCRSRATKTWSKRRRPALSASSTGCSPYKTSIRDSVVPRRLRPSKKPCALARNRTSAAR